MVDIWVRQVPNLHLTKKYLEMSIHFSGTFTRSAGVISAITKQLKFVNLKPVKKIEVQFDPFQEHAVTARWLNTRYWSVLFLNGNGRKRMHRLPNRQMRFLFYRNFMHHISSNKVARTNPNCAVRANVVCDRSEPKITVHLLEAGWDRLFYFNLRGMYREKMFSRTWYVLSSPFPKSVALVVIVCHLKLKTISSYQHLRINIYFRQCCLVLFQHAYFIYQNFWNVKSAV